MKKTLKRLSLIFVVFMLAGCMKINLNLEVKTDKSMAMNMDMLVEESLITSNGLTTEQWIEQIKQKALQNETMKDAKMKEISKTIDGKKWVGVSMSEISNNAQDIMVKEKDIDGTKSLVLTLPMNTMKNQMGSSGLGDFGSAGYSISKMKDLGLEMNVSIKMPAKATTNVGKADGDTVTIDLLELLANGSTQDIVISSPVSAGFDMTIIFIVIGLAVIAGIVLVILKTKKKPEEQTFVNEAPVAMEVEKIQESTETVEEQTSTEPVAEVTTDKKYCPNCGQPIEDVDTCPHCGFDIKK